MKKFLFACLLFCCSSFLIQGQDGTVRGFVYDKETGEPILFTNVIVEGTSLGGTTDLDGLYVIPKVPFGQVVLVCSYVGYETARVEISLNQKVRNQTIYLESASTQLQEIRITADKQEAKTEVQTSTIKITPKDMDKLPSVSGDPDLAQYLQVLPGVTFTGDQGGQLYVRGGSPIQTNVLMDGITVYNPFHSIGFFSVFDTDIIRDVNVLTGGFNATYGGRISAIVDVKTRDGNKTKLAGKVSANPFLAKILLEAPIKKFNADKGGGYSSFIISAKRSYLDQTGDVVFDYVEGEGLPYSFTDIYGKFSSNSANGSKFSLSGYRYDDSAAFSTAVFDWRAYGVGANFSIIPEQSKVIIGGALGFSQYDLDLDRPGNLDDNTSSIGGFTLALDFRYFLPKGSLKYGVNIGGFRTELEFRSPSNIIIDPTENTTNLAFFLDYKQEVGKLIVEPSVRFNYYGALAQPILEPRFGMKYNITNDWRFKMSGGRYSQDLISSKSDEDIVNLFTGFLTAPDGRLTNREGEESNNNLQVAWHAVAGFEYDLTNNLSLDLEGYYKDFTQLVNINREKLVGSDPDFIAEEGDAYGFDFLAKFDKRRWFIWAVYSLQFVNRDDGEQVFPPHFDRRHNTNFLCSYAFGSDLDWTFNARWNFGSGFPFTKTQGFFEELDFSQGISTDVVTQNGDLGIIFDETLNGGRLPSYHRLDVSLKKSFYFGDDLSAEVTASVTNLYDRDNIFFFDRVEFERVDQLPLLPSLGVSFSF